MIPEFDWFEERLELARWESETIGSREAFFACPVHGGSDSLHVTEKNGKALVFCFACEAKTAQVVEALESATPIRITRVRGRRVSRSKPKPLGASAESVTGGSTPPRLHPRAWTAQRCAMTEEELVALKLPLSFSRTHAVFEFAGSTSTKTRGVSEAKEKDIAWTPGPRPEFWPVPPIPADHPLIVLTEGEFDAICLRRAEYDAYSVTAGAKTEVSPAAWDALRASGVSEVWVAFDLDREGRRGRDAAIEGIRAAGMVARSVRPVGIDVLAGEKDARDVALRSGHPVRLEEDASEEDAVSIRRVEMVPSEPLLLGWLHPLEHTVLFGDGGTGKGVVAAQWVADLVRAGTRVLIVDYEQHARHEWRPRIQRFLCGHDEFHLALCPEAEALIDEVYYVQPVRPIWEIASWLRAQAEKVAAKYLVVDSVTFATAGSPPEESGTATKYLQAVNMIGYPILSIAHVTKSDGDPKHPFGSVHWHNGARVTIGIAQVGEEFDSDRALKHKKANQGQQHASVSIPWRWVRDALPPRLEFPRLWKSDQEAYEMLRADAHRDPTAAELSAAIGKDVTDAYVALMAKRSTKKGTKAIGYRRARKKEIGSAMDDDHLT